MPLMKITKDSQDLVVIEHKPGLFEYVLSIASILLIRALDNWRSRIH